MMTVGTPMTLLLVGGPDYVLGTRTLNEEANLPRHLFYLMVIVVMEMLHLSTSTYLMI